MVALQCMMGVCNRCWGARPLLTVIFLPSFQCTVNDCCYGPLVDCIKQYPSHKTLSLKLTRSYSQGRDVPSFTWHKSYAWGVCVWSICSSVFTVWIMRCSLTSCVCMWDFPTYAGLYFSTSRFYLYHCANNVVSHHHLYHFYSANLTESGWFQQFGFHFVLIIYHLVNQISWLSSLS